jgi:hypothetical protein
VGNVNGNSYDSPETTYLYELRDAKTGEFLKWGITQDTNARYSGSVRAQVRMRVIAWGNRVDMAAVEQILVRTMPGPWNKESFAGKGLRSGVDDWAAPEVVP